MANRINFDEIPAFLEKNSIVVSTVSQIFKNLRDNYQKFGKVTDEDLQVLSSVFNETLEKALEIVEGNKVTYFHTKSNIVGLYQVEGKSYKTYTIFPAVNYCSCPSFKYQVSNGSQVTCKHVLATVIADAINTKNSIEVTNEHLNDLLLVSVSLNYFLLQGNKMNDREDWNNRDPYLGQFIHANPLPGISPTPRSTAFAPGISTTFGISPNNWVHVPPQTMPWGTPPEAQPAIVRFTAGDFSPHLVPIKRKCESPLDTSPSKMLVTEEKMAAHMRDLHISDVEPSAEMANITCKEEPMETERLPKLIISDEIKNLKTESIIPESILKKLEKPEMALVLWQPPATDLGSKLRELKKLSLNKGKEKEIENKDEGEMDIETENNNTDNVFRPIDPVPMPSMQNQFFQPVPQFHGYSPFLQNIKTNFQSKFS